MIVRSSRRALIPFAIVLFTTASATLARAQSHHGSLPHNIPDFCAAATISSAGSGAWSNPGTWSGGRVPASGDIVAVAPGHTVTYDADSNESITCVGVQGQLTFATDRTTRLKVGTLMVYVDGSLVIGRPESPVPAGQLAQIVFADLPLDLTRDPEQFGTGLIGVGNVVMAGQAKTTFARTASAPRSGDTQIRLATAVENWRPGDRVIVPDSQQFNALVGQPWIPRWEERTVASVSGDGLTVTITAPLTYEHPAGKDADGVVSFLPHVMNLSRNVVLRSENPSGTRAHGIFTARANVDIRYASLRDMGRTKVDRLDSTKLDSGGTPTHIGTNQIGRYPIHLHHLTGPSQTPSNGYQFTLIGNSVDGGSSDHNFKWGIVLHNTHYGLVNDNAVYNMSGGGIIGEDGSESENLIAHNIVVRCPSIYPGSGHERTDTGDFAWEGSAFWFRGPFNIVRDNVAANAYAYGYKMLFYFGSNVRTPSYKGADPSVDAQMTLKSSSGSPLREFSGNEQYGDPGGGLSIWWLCANFSSPSPNCGTSRVLNFKTWNHGQNGLYGYGISNTVFDGWVQRGDPAAVGYADNIDRGLWFGDYFAHDVVITRADIQNVETAIVAPTYAQGTFTVSDSLVRVTNGIIVWTIGAPGSQPGGPWFPRTIKIHNVRFGPVHGSGSAPQQNIIMAYNTWGGSANLVMTDVTSVTSYDGVDGANFQLYYPQQAASFLVPQTTGLLTGAPVAGLTNQQTWNTFGIAIAGSIARCEDTRPKIYGFACSGGVVLSPPPAQLTPSAPRNVRIVPTGPE